MRSRRNSWPQTPRDPSELRPLIENPKVTEKEDDSDDQTSSSISIARPSESKFASIQYVRDFCPHLLSDVNKAGWKWAELFSTQRKVLIIQQILIVVVLIINIVISIVGSVKYSTYEGVGTLYLGRCDVAKKLNMWFHFLINVLSTLLLGASHYSMQLLVAPTREEIDKAHQKGIWLDIGISSIRNLRYIEKKKAAVWFILGFSSTCLHLVWNSAVFNTIPVYSYTAAFATNDFFTNNATWNVSLNLNPGGTNLELLRETGSGFEKLNRTECIQRYMSPFNSGKDLIVVTNWTDNKRSLHDGTSLITAFQNPLSGPDWDTENIWLCFDNGTWPKTCNTKGAAIMATNWTVNNDYYSVSDGRWSAPVDYCLSAGTNLANVNCGFHWSITIMALVSALNFVKLICIVLVARWTHKSSLITLGDAISNFLQRPDPYTRGMCLSSKSSFSKRTRNKIPANITPRRRLWWFSGASRTRWILTLLSVLTTLLVAIFLMYQIFLSLASQSLPRSLPALWGWGLGAANTVMVVGGWVKDAGGKTPTRQFFVSVIVANLPQIVLSYLYLLYNGLLTCLLVGAEWSNFAVHKKSLRVSEKATGFQTSGFFLSMPYRYGIPLSCASSLLHWFTSQTLFLIKTAGFGSNGEMIHPLDGSRVGYSPVGPIFLLALGGVMLFVMILSGFKKYPSAARFMPMAATNSAAISAASHRPVDDEDAHLFPVRWGEVSWDEESGKGHCSFTTASDVKLPKEGRSYS